MTSAVEGMLPVTLPRFASSKSSAAAATSDKNWVENAEALDFDLLAEYLLDEGSSSAADGDAFGISAFDFSLDSATASGVVSPEQSEDGLPDISSSSATAPKQDSSVVQVQNIIAAHASAQSAPPAAAPAATAAPPPPAPAPAQATLAPAPPKPPVQSGIPMAPAPAVGTFPPNLSSAPPIAAAPPALVLHQHAAAAAAAAAAAPGNKRRRMDAAPMMAVSGGPRGQFMPVPGRGRQKSQAQIDRRRERNRILARRTRLRKKFFFESLQKDVIEMQRENAALKEIVRRKLAPDKAKQLLAECDAKLPNSVLEACGESATEMEAQDYSLVKSIQGSQQCFIITDPSLQDNPIVYASDDFLKLTGYAREDVLGRNCRFLQGTETSANKVEKVRKAVANGEDVTVTMINYTADGTAFWNKLFVAALRDAQNNIVNFIGVIVKVASPEPGDEEAGKALPENAEATMKGIEGAVSAAVANAANAPGPFFS